jgi:PPE-repeat protein
MTDFAVVPPEVTSARLYAGPGAGPMRAAGAAWGQLAAELRTTAASYQAVVAGVIGSSWSGSGAAAMAGAAGLYVDWLSATATQVEQTAAQAQAAASAYEAAITAAVPPAVIAANRAQLAALVATNVVGQNSAAIAATEAHYEQMWAQDAAAMYGYAGASAAASRLTPFTAAPVTTTAGALDGHTAAAAAATGAAAGTSPASQLATWLGLAPGSDTATTGLAGLLNYLDGNNGSLLGSFLNDATVSNFSNALTTSGLTNPTTMLDSAMMLTYLLPAMAANSGGMLSSTAPLTAGLGLAPAAATLGPASLPGLAAASAALGHAAPLGALSVPQSWIAGAPGFTKIAAQLPAATSLSPALGATPLVAPDTSMGMPGMPLATTAAMAAHHMEEEPLYGFRPIVMARPPAAG